jgi:glycosyl-4,4'-diaponeurosporenoate acyltransferase
MKWSVFVANILGWPIIQLGIAWCMTRVSPYRFAKNGRIWRVAAEEALFYRGRLRICRWKSMLPDGAEWVGGKFPRKKLRGHDANYLSLFIVETKRGELAHWIMFACFPLFYPWNPLWVWPIMAFYAFVSNVPCIIVQRYNRMIAYRLLSRLENNQS